MRIHVVLIKIVRFLEDGLEPPLTYDEAHKRLLLLNICILIQSKESSRGRQNIFACKSVSCTNVILIIIIIIIHVIVIVITEIGTNKLVGCFSFNGPLRQYFSLYRAVFQSGRKKTREKMSNQPPPAPNASAVGQCPSIIQIIRTTIYWRFTQHHGSHQPLNE